jgi:hypothetical protein
VKRFKQPTIEEGDRFKYPVSLDVSQDTLHPAFCFRYVQSGLSNIQKAHKVSALNKLKTLGKMSWAQIKQSSRRKNGYEIIQQLKSEIPRTFKNRYPDTEVIGFYCGTNGRMYGIRKQKVFYIFWFDWTPFSLIKH